MKNSNVPIHHLRAQLPGHDEVVLQDRQGLSSEDTAKLRAIKCRIIWSERPTMKVRFLDGNGDLTELFYRPDEDVTLSIT